MFRLKSSGYFVGCIIIARLLDGKCAECKCFHYYQEEFKVFFDVVTLSLPPTSHPHLHHTTRFYTFALSAALQTNPLQTNPKQVVQSQCKNGGEGVNWAAATARLHPIRIGSVEKRCGLEPVTSVPVPSAPTAFCRERQREGG